MCGFLGVLGCELKLSEGERALDTIAHRGPDERGHFHEEDVYLGHVRLRVIDLHGGKQPMEDPSGRYIIVYNGEVYNFRELRQELLDRGFEFNTHSDTEVVLALFIAEGPNMLRRLNGVYAFAIWDRLEKTLFACRDPYGVKPLHIWQQGGILALASEYKAFLRLPFFSSELCSQSLHYYLNLRFVPGDRTLMKGVRRLPPGSTLWYAAGRTIVRPPEPNGRSNAANGSYEDHVEAVRPLIKQAVRRQLIADVPIGVSLSGGMDSSTLVAMMAEEGARINAFTVAFGEPTDETADAQFVAQKFGAQHYTIRMSPEPLSKLPVVTWHIEEPKVNALQGYLLSAFVKQHVSVLLSGLGGDELFGGYSQNRYLMAGDFLRKVLQAPPLARAGDRFAHWLYRFSEGRLPLAWEEPRRGLQMLAESGQPELFYGILRNVWDHDRPLWRRIYRDDFLQGMPFNMETASILRPHFPRDKTILEGGLEADFRIKMINDFLVNEDRTSMAHGVEARVPFLDRDLVDFVRRIPVTYLVPGGKLKKLMKDAMAPYLPSPILEKKKWGFAVNPYHQYLKDLKFVAERMLTPERLRQRGIFRFNMVREILAAPPHPRLRWHYFFLWILVGIEVWIQMFIEGRAPDKNSPIEDYFA
jgi:asparagine synthase (glutamine-hydrolysing)